MALGQITVLDKHQISGTLNHDEIVFTGDSAYTLGGTPGFQALVRKVLGKGNVTIIDVDTQDSGGLTAVYDVNADKLKIYNGQTEQTAGDHSNTTIRLVVVSK